MFSESKLQELHAPLDRLLQQRGNCRCRHKNRRGSKQDDDWVNRLLGIILFKGENKRATGAVSRPETSRWRPFWLKMIGLGDANFTLSAPMTFVGIQGSFNWIWSKWLPVPTKSLWTGSHFWEKVARSLGPVPNLLIFPLILLCLLLLSYTNSFTLSLAMLNDTKSGSVSDETMNERWL